MGEVTEPLLKRLQRFNDELSAKHPKLKREERLNLLESFIKAHDDRGLLVVERGPRGEIKFRELNAVERFQKQLQRVGPGRH